MCVCELVAVISGEQLLVCVCVGCWSVRRPMAGAFAFELIAVLLGGQWLVCV